jgi:Putative peptidoglycan binding domain
MKHNAMRLFFVLACCLAIPLAAYAADQGNDNKKKKQGGQGQSQQHVLQQHFQQQHTPQQGLHPNAGNPNKGNKWNNANYPIKGNKGNKNWNNANNPNNPNNFNYSNKGNKGNKNWSNANNPNNPNNLNYSNKGNKGNKNWNNANNPHQLSGGGQVNKAKIQTKHYDFSNKPNPKIQSVRFENNYRIRGAENWKGERYAAFRNYHSEWHDQGWWNNHYNRVVFISGGWYAWNGGWWYPAWGYAPNAYYAYNGPIYGYNGLPPDQVIGNVQAALQEQGYYQGEVDGLLGPQTRGAIADYQRANGLEETAAIDEPTLESLGMT